VYACDVTAVREVVPLDARARLTRLPGAPPAVVGLLNVRGKIVTVVDAGALLHGGRAGGAEPGAGAMVLIVDCGARGVGLAVERVADVRALRVEEGYSQLDVRALVRAAVVITEE
jgi:purine-binding chemotaxis protein CheW